MVETDSPTAHSLNARMGPISPRAEAVVVAVLVAIIYYATSIAGALKVGSLTDDGVYMTLGKAIAEGKGYRSLHLIGAPVQVKYPPGFPAILALLWSFGHSVDAVQHLVALLHPLVIGLAVGLLWWVGRHRLEVPAVALALAVVLPFLLDAGIDYYTMVLSEPWFILGWAGVLALWMGTEELEAGRRRLLRLAACGGLVAITSLIRTQAVVLLPALAVSLASRRFRARERVVVGVTVLAPLLAWQAYHSALIARGPVSRLPDEGPYIEWIRGSGAGLLGAVAAGAGGNVRFYLSQFGNYLSAIPPLGRVAAALLLCAGAIGAGWAVRRRPLLGLSALGGLGVVIAWPFAEDRLLLPLLPFLGLAACAAIPWRAGAARPAYRRAAALVGILAMGGVLLRQAEIRAVGVTAFAENREPPFFTPSWLLPLNSRYIAAASRWVRDNTPPAAHLMIDNHPGIYLYSGRPTVPANPSESRLLESVHAVPGEYLASRILLDSLDYVIIGLRHPEIMRDLATVIARCPGVLTWGGTSPNDSKYIFRVRRDDACLRQIAGPAG